MLHENPSLFLSSTKKGSFQVARERFFLMNFSYQSSNAMQEAKNLFISDDEKLCYVNFFQTRYFKIGNVRRRLSVSDGQTPTWTVYL